MDPHRIRMIVSVAAGAQQLVPVWYLLWHLTLAFGLVSCISAWMGLMGVGSGGVRGFVASHCRLLMSMVFACVELWSGILVM